MTERPMLLIQTLCSSSYTACRAAQGEWAVTGVTWPRLFLSAGGQSPVAQPAACPAACHLNPPGPLSLGHATTTQHPTLRTQHSQPDTHPCQVERLACWGEGGRDETEAR
ncbi:hypothetical protein E2C01_005702 [Portunus trituberculatus]|uniref:Uncharacterized protein n=1 Tax=Portunus trituberculatus TaxID=210409 RepID=A0A5B7CV21_PORTR|nr:hypothetical protein [Portunus trituberculatus]